MKTLKLGLILAFGWLGSAGGNPYATDELCHELNEIKKKFMACDGHYSLKLKPADGEIGNSVDDALDLGKAAFYIGMLLNDVTSCFVSPSMAIAGSDDDGSLTLNFRWNDASFLCTGVQWPDLPFRQMSTGEIKTRAFNKIVKVPNSRIVGFRCY